jgi:thiol-disulfide isomerase/thioredoxin
MKLKVIGLLLGGLILGIFLGFLVSWSSGKSTSTQTNGTGNQPFPSQGLPFADFELGALKGPSVKLTQFRGLPVIINFWATWCGPCKEEMPLLQKTYADLGGKLVILGVNVQESPDIVSPFVSQYGITFPILLDQDGMLENRFAVRGYPTSFFIDPKGVLQAQHIGELSGDLLAGYLKMIGVSR